MTWLLLLVLGCVAPEGEGIAVGNPGLTTISVAESEGMALRSASGTVGTVGFEGCDEADEQVSLGLSIDLAVAVASFDFPAGTWCGFEVALVDGLHVEADWTGPNGETATVTADLDLARVQLRPVDETLRVEEATELVLELGTPGWLDSEALGLQDGDVLDLVAGDAGHDALVEALREDSAAFDDLDGDGLVGIDERTDGPLAEFGEISIVPAGLYSTADSSQGSCAGGGSYSVFLLLPLGLLRRRPRPVPPGSR